VEVLCVSQGKDGMMWQKGKLAAKSVDGNTGATCVLGLVDAKSCSVCGGHKQRPLFDVKPIKLGKVPEEAEVVKGHGYRVPVVYRIIQCQHCGFIYVANQQGDLSSLYESEYFERSSDKRRMKLATARQEMRAIREVIGADIGRELKMVDCGPGDGYHLEIAQSEFGWDAEGVDVSDAAINNCSSRGLVVKKGTLKEQEYEGNSIDLVTLFATVEHLTDPRGEIEEINRILKPGGHVVLTRLPNLDSEVGAAQGSEYYDIKVGHLNYFSPGTIRRLLEEKGFEVVFIKTTVNDWIVEEHRNGRISDEDFNRIMQNKEAIEQSGRGELVTVVAKKVYGRDEKKPVSQGSHLVRKVKGDEAEKPLYDFTINEKGELSGDDDVYAPTLKLCMERLIHIYGLGILTRIKNIQVIENLNGGNLYPIGRAPLASYKDDILKIDVLAFENGPWILFEEIEHEFIESIAGLIPGDNEILADIVSTYRNVLRFLNPNDGITNTRFKYDVPVYQEGILSVLRAPANPIDPDGEYLALLERLLKLKEQDKLSEDEIIVRVVQYIMRTKLYEKVRQQLGLEDDIAKKIRDMDPKLDDALSIFNEITKAKNSVDLMDKIRRTSRGTIIVTKTFTGLRAKGLEKISKGLAEIVGALVKQVNNTDKLSAMLTNKDTTKKYIFVNSDGLNRLKEAMGEKDYQAVVDNLERNNIELVTEMPEEVALENVIRLVEDPDVLKDMPKIEGMYYLPMPYTRSAVYMAANIIQAKGDLSLIPLVRELIKDLYKELSEDDLRLLITQPWTILPKINPVIQEINEIREEIFEIERAA
jgi:ubiquinone/menaquinone biosynthesis C-methylase UbiE